jgi:hypothetical protein
MRLVTFVISVAGAISPDAQGLLASSRLLLAAVEARFPLLSTPSLPGPPLGSSRISVRL